MNKLLRTLITGLVTLSCIVGCDWRAATQALPTRAQCISGAQIVWPENISETEITEQVNSIAEVIKTMRPAYVAAFRFQDDDAIYAILESHCDEKDSIFGDLVDQLSAAVMESVSFKLIDGEIRPSPETILVYGKSWQDGQLPDGMME